LSAQAVSSSIKDVVMPTPNAASLGKYGDIPVSFNTGIPNVGIPIHTLTEGPISLPISLSYHAGGLKVGEPTSWAGLGWSLSAGGMISRTVQGRADESCNGFFNMGHQVGVTTMATTSCITEVAGGITNGELASGTKDGEPDIFSFSIGGYSGKFYITAPTLVGATLSPGKVVLIPKQDVSITYTATASTDCGNVYRLKKFTVVTPDGVKYDFGSNGVTAEDAIEITSNNTSSFKQASGWYLKKITSADGVNSITLNYTAEKYRYTYKTSSGTSPTLINSWPLNSTSGSYPQNCVDVGGFRLKDITTSTEKVTFVAGTDRTVGVSADLATNPDASFLGETPKSLGRIKVENGTMCKDFILYQSYFQDNDATHKSGQFTDFRLRLDSIQEKSCDATTAIPPHVFTYYTKAGNPNYLPNRLSSAIDHWGYYNGALTNPHNGINMPYTRLRYFDKTISGLYPNGRWFNVWQGTSNRETDEENMKLGTIQQIKYPTGGNSTFEYEANSYWDTEGIRELQDVVSSTNTWPSVYCASNPTPQNPTAFNPGVVAITNPEASLTVTFTAAQLNNTSLTNLELMYYKIESKGGSVNQAFPCNTSPVPTIEVYAIQTNNPTNICQSQAISTSSDGTPRLEKGALIELFPCLLPNVSYTFVTRVARAGMKFTLQKEVLVTPAFNHKVGGLRIKKMTNNDAVAVANDVVKTYQYGTTISTATLYNKPVYGYVHESSNIGLCNGVALSSTNYFINHFFMEQSIVPLGSFEGSHINYSAVQENYVVNNVTQYYSVYQYYNEGAPTFSGLPLTPQQPRIGSGELTRKEQYKNGSTTPIAWEETTTNPETFEYSPTDYIKFNTYRIGGDGTPISFWKSYKVRNKPYRLSQMVSYLDGVTTTTDYTYDTGVGAVLPKRTESVTNSNGAVTTSTYFYAQDAATLANNARNQELINRNMIGFPIKTRQVTGTSTKWSKVDYTVFYTSQLEPEYLRECFEATPVNWIDRLRISAYTTNGMPSTIYKNNFAVPETYTWNNKLLTQKVFGNVANNILTSNIFYKTGTSLVEKMMDADSLSKIYTYDALSRLITVKDRTDLAGANAQATTNYTYQYKDLTNTLNFIRTSTTFLNASSTTPLSTKQLMDGLGRPVSIIRELFTPNNLNQKNNVTYDALGRQDKSYLPFEGTTTNYEATPALTPNSYPTYEASPLNRPIRQYAEDGKYMEMRYETNDGTVNKYIAVRNADGTNTVTFGTPYPAGYLFKTVMLNENWNGSTDVNIGRTEIYKDKLGRVILTRKCFNIGGGNYDKVDTYNIYDDYDNLVMVIPPGAYLSDVALLFQYNYDTRNRLIRKKVPNADWINFYYDVRDLLVMTQDGNMRVATASATSTTIVPKFLATQYDEIGRVVKTGFTTTAPIISTTGNTLGNCTTDIAATITDKLTETQYYRNHTWVKHQGAKVLKKTGVVTERDFVWSYIERRATTGYNGNPAWTAKQHLLSKTYVGVTPKADGPIADSDNSGLNWVVSDYDGAQKPLYALNYMFTNTNAQQVRQWQTFVYDNGQRLKSSNYTYALNGAAVTSPTAKMSDMTYNVRNQLIEKNTAFVSNKYLQSTDFAYNDRGWLTSINSGFLPSTLDYPLFDVTAPGPVNQYTSLGGPTGTGFLTPPANSGESNPDLFKEIIRYDLPNTAYPNNGLTVTPQYNGNISQIEWQVAGREAQGYTFNYDNLERLTEANYTDIHAADWSAKGWTSQYATDNKLKEAITYDLRGNIKTLNRKGNNAATSSTITIGNAVMLSGDFKLIDNLTYTYNGSDANKLEKVADATSIFDRGFKSISNTTAIQYTYDANGNLITDANKGITGITYNHLNLPLVITFTNNALAQPRSIEFIYDATGAKLRKTVFVNSVATETRDYVNGIEYKDNVLDRFAHTEGAVVKQGVTTTYLHEYTIKDHLGNTRVTYTDANNDGIVGASDIKQVNHYYPFGLNMEGNWNGAAGTNKYQYNGKEWNDDFGLGLNDYGARFYDAAIGRWTAVDPLAGKYFRYSPYNYCKLNPIKFIDPNGMEVIDKDDRTTYTGADATKKFYELNGGGRGKSAPEGIHLNSVGDIMWNTTKKGDATPNVYLTENGKSTLLGKIGGTINIDVIYRNLLEQNIKLATGIYDPRLFKDYVNYGGIWDYKARYNQKGRLNTIFGMVNLFYLNNTKFSFYGVSMASQDIGNHHYAVVGKATGLFSEEFLLYQAGVAQIKNKTSSPEWQKWEIHEDGDGVSAVMLPPYGDDPRDQAWIKAGFTYFDNLQKYLRP
jgi:RHS repeat-associated protein